MENLISIVVPIYNVEEYLDKCVNSLVNQTHKNLEIILVDDGSPDKCPEICDSWKGRDSRIKVIHKKNGGVSSARNMGLENATGQFITFVDPDDYLDLDALEKLLMKQKENNYDLVLCNYKKVYKDKTIYIQENLKGFCESEDISYMVLSYPKLKKIKENYFINCNNNILPSACKCLYKKEVLKQTKFNENLKYGEDSLFFIKVFCSTTLTCSYVEDCFYNYYVREQSLSNGVIKNFVKQNIDFIDALTPYLIKTNRQDLITARKFYAYFISVINNIKQETKEDLKDIKIWNTRENYLAYKKYCNGFLIKIKLFLVHHNLTYILKILNKLRRKK